MKGNPQKEEIESDKVEHTGKETRRNGPLSKLKVIVGDTDSLAEER